MEYHAAEYVTKKLKKKVCQTRFLNVEVCFFPFHLYL